MDLLLQAAKVLEEDDSSDRAQSESARGFQYGRSEDDSNEHLGLQYSDEGRGTHDDDTTNIERRRAGGAGTREVHNQLEKNRRKQLRECFNHLQQCVPSLENKRVATQSILQGAIKFIKHLKKKDVEQERDIQMLAKRKSELKKKYDQERNKCSEEEQRLADMLLKTENAHNIEEVDDGNTSDSTTTASEGPENEDDLSDTDVSKLETRYSITSYDKYEVSRKRKASSRIDSGSSNDPGTSRNHGTILRQAAQSKTSQPSSSAPVSSAMSTTSSVALKQMLEQRKKQQVSVSNQGLRPAPKVMKSPTKSFSGSLTSSYPMISGHLASTPKSKVPSHPVPALPNPTRPVAGMPKPSDLVGTHPQSTLLLHTSNGSTTLENTLASFATKSKQSDELKHSGNQMAQASPTVMINSIPSLTIEGGHINLGSASNAFSTSVTSSVKSCPVKTLNPAAMLTSNLAFLPPQLNNTNKLQLETRRWDGSFSNHLKILSGTSTPSVSTAAISTQRSASSFMDSSKILPVIPASLAPLIRTLPIGSSLPSMTVTPASSRSSIPLSSSVITSQSSLTQEHSTFKSTDPNTTNTDPSLPLASRNTRIATLLATPSPAAPLRSSSMNLISAQGTNAIPMSLADIHKSIPLNPAALLPLAASRPHSSMANSISLSDDVQKMISFTPTLLSHQQLPKTTTASNSAALTLSDAQKNMTLTQAMLPLSLASTPNSTSTSVISQGTPIRFFTPVSPSMMANLGNGQTHLMPTVLQLASSGMVLQNLIQAGGHPLLAQPIMVMTTPSPVNTTSQTMAGTKGTTVTSPSFL